jgi:biopolymer transport protein ExbD/biopolymer transport protein TolR
VRCDKELQYGRIMELLDQVGAGGVSSLSLVAENTGGPGQPEGIRP